ncbi:MAG: hypothetical protein U5N56_00865 [Candidatus Marinimicrobia bacterium]|nr:hypothetical protein [Candidatus Neomarinimicrobiota bacterium]
MKLQKQVDFLERHPGYVLCCGGYETLNEETGEKYQDLENAS